MLYFAAVTAESRFVSVLAVMPSGKISVGGASGVPLDMKPAAASCAGVSREPTTVVLGTGMRTRRNTAQPAKANVLAQN